MKLGGQGFCSKQREMINTFKILSGKFEWKRQIPWRPERRWENIIKMDLKERE
jgi:hypothetical protein